MGPGELQLPPELPNWRVVKEALRELRGKLVNKTTNPQEVGWFMEVIYATIQSDQCSPGNVGAQLSLLRAKVRAKVKAKLDPTKVWYGVAKYLKKVPAQERDQFLGHTLPAIVEYGLRLEELMKKESVVWGKQQQGGKIVLSRRFVCSIVACFFLCLFPERKRHGNKQPVNIINFTSFFKHLPTNTQIAKLRCILHYFECVIQRNMDIEGQLVFHRKVASSDWTLNFDQLMDCSLALCPLQVFPEGKLEDSGREVIQVCFGNRSLGGGALGRSRVQEEIKFCTNPELIAAMLMMENMEDNESIEISGFEQMSCYRGYADSFQYDGHCDEAFRDSGRFYMVTIDATSYRGKAPVKQYEEDFVLRDFNKALVGFCDALSKQINLPTCKSNAEESKLPESQTDATAKRRISASKKSFPETSGTSPSSSSWQQHPRFETFAHSPPEQESRSRKSEWRDEQFLPGSVESPYSQFTDRQRPQHPPAAGRLAEGGSSLSSSHGDHVEHVLLEPSSASDQWPPFPPLSRQCSDSSEANVNRRHHRIPPSPDDASPAITVPTMSMASSSPVPIPSPAAFTGTAVANRSSTPTWPHLDSPASSSSLHPFLPAADSPQAFSAHSNVQLTAPCLNLATSDVADASFFSNDSAIGGTEPPCSQVDSKPCPSLPRALLSDPTPSSLFDSVSEEGKSVGRPAKFYSDVLGNLTTASTSGALHFMRANDLPAYPLTLFRSPDPLEAAGFHSHSHHHSPQLLTVTAFSTEMSNRDYDDIGPRQSACGSSFESEPRSLSQIRQQEVVEMTGSDISNYSTKVCVDSQRDSLHSLDDCGSNVTSPGHEGDSLSMADALLLDDPPLMASADEPTAPPSRTPSYSTEREPLSAPSHHLPSQSDAPTAHLELPRSSSPLSSTSSLNHSANSSTGGQEKPGVKAQPSRLVEDFFIPGELSNPRNGTKDFHREVRDWISASSSSSVVPAPSSSSNEGSRWGSRSGSLSSHTTSGSHHDVSDMWTSQRRRSSQMSDLSRRSSSSKHSSDLGTDLEELSESLAKQGHTVIEEEGSQMALNFDLDDMDAGVVDESQVQAEISVEQAQPALEQQPSTDGGVEGSVSAHIFYNLPPPQPPDGEMEVIDVERPLRSSTSELVESGDRFGSIPSATSAAEAAARPELDFSAIHPTGKIAPSDDDPKSKSNNEGATSLCAEGDPPCISGSSPSRYLFSDVASAPSDQSKHEYRVISPIPAGRGGGFLQNLIGPGNVHETRSEMAKAGWFSSALISLFVSNLAKIAVCEACKEVTKLRKAQKLSQRSNEKEVISDEIYTMFATDIVNHVFVHVLSSIESRDSESPMLSSISLNIPSPEDLASLSGHDKPGPEESPELPLSVASPSTDSANYLSKFHPKSAIDLSSSRGEVTVPTTPLQPPTAIHRSAPSLTAPNPKPSSQKPKNSSTLITKASGICKTVSFEDSCVDATTKSDADSPISGGLAQPDDECALLSPSLSLTAVFQRPGFNLSSPSSSSLSLFTAKDAGLSPLAFSQPSLDSGVSTTSSAASPCAPPPRLSHSQSALELTCRHSLAPPSDHDFHQAATAIVSQVFQSISDSLAKDGSWVNPGSGGGGGGGGGFSDSSAADSSMSPVPAAGSYRWGQGEAFTSNIFSSSPIKTPHHHHHHHHHHNHHHHHHRSQSPGGAAALTPGGVVSRKPMSREGLTNAFLKVDSTPSVKSYERRSSEPCHTSVQLSLQAFNDNRYSCSKHKEEEKRLGAKQHCSTDDEMHHPHHHHHHHDRKWRRGSLDGFSFEQQQQQRRNSCGFKDPILSRFAEELMKADTSVPELVIFGSRHNSSTTGSRRSSISGFKDTTLANLESELLNTSFTSICSLSLSQSPRSQHRHSRASGRSRSWELRQGKSDSSDTEHFFPLPRYVGDEFLQEYRKQYGHEDDDKDASGSNLSMVVANKSCDQQDGPPWEPLPPAPPSLAPHTRPTDEEQRAVETFASSLTDHILLEAFSCHYVEGQALPHSGIADTGPDSDQRRGRQRHHLHHHHHHHSWEDVSSSGGDGRVVSGNLSTLVAGGGGRAESEGGDGDALPVYFGEGARPKMASEPRRTSSKARAIPHSSKGGGSRRREDSASSCDGLGGAFHHHHHHHHHNVSVSSGDLSSERKSYQPIFKRLLSRERHHAAGGGGGKTTATSSTGKSVSAASMSVPELTMSMSSSGSLPAFTGAESMANMTTTSLSKLSGSSSDLMTPSPSSASLHQRPPLRREERRRRASSETSTHPHPYTNSAGDRPMAVAKRDREQYDAALKLQSLRYESGHDDSVERILLSCSSDSSAHSGQTRSSVLSSSSLSDSEGSKPRLASGKAKVSHAERKKRMVVRQVKEAGKAAAAAATAAASAASSSSSMPTSSGQHPSQQQQHQQRPPRRERGRKRSLTKPRPKRHSRGDAAASHFLQSPRGKLYAQALSTSIVAEALKDFAQLRWQMYLSYGKPIATGNWGCGAFRGNPQLKLVLQWLAASIAKAPTLLYYSFGDGRLSQAQDVVRELSTWSVGQLAMALHGYLLWARGHLSDDPSGESAATSGATSWIYGLLHLKIGCGRQPSAQRAPEEEALPITLFDFLLNFRKNKQEEEGEDEPS